MKQAQRNGRPSHVAVPPVEPDPSSVLWWNEIRALTAYVEQLRKGRDPSHRDMRALRRDAFPRGSTSLLETLHEEFAPDFVETLKAPPKRRETPSERRRRVIKEQMS